MRGRAIDGLEGAAGAAAAWRLERAMGKLALLRSLAWHGVDAERAMWLSSAAREHGRGVGQRGSDRASGERRSEVAYTEATCREGRAEGMFIER